MARSRGHSRSRAHVRKRSRRRDAANVPAPPLPGEAVDESAPNEFDFNEVSDNSEVDEAETGVLDRFSAHQSPLDPSTRSSGELDAEIGICGGHRPRPAIVFLPNNTNGVDYAITEYCTSKQWRTLDAVADLILTQHGHSWNKLLTFIKEPSARSRRIPQTKLTKQVGVAASDVSESLRSSILSVDGHFVEAIAFFRANAPKAEREERIQSAMELVKAETNRPDLLIADKYGVSQSTAREDCAEARKRVAAESQE